MYCRMQKQRRGPVLPSEAGRKRIHSTEQYCFQSGEITSDLFGNVVTFSTSCYLMIFILI